MTARILPDDPRHGTDAGYQAHRKDGEGACRPCRQAHAEKMGAYRLDPTSKRTERERDRASSRALWALVERHRDEYEALYADALAEQRRTARAGAS